MKKISSIVLAFFLTLAAITPAAANTEATGAPVPPASANVEITPLQDTREAAPPQEGAGEITPPQEGTGEIMPPQEEKPALSSEPAAEADGAPVIQVTVPQSGQIIINPYGLEREIDGGVSTEQIVSETLVICNESEVPVIVSASAAGQISELSGMAYVPAPPQADTVEKEIFLYAEFQNEDGLWNGSYHNGQNQILISEEVSAAKEVLALEAGPSEGVFRLFGATTVSPEEPWSTEDSISVIFTFTFSPVIEPSEDTIMDGEQLAPEEGPVSEKMPVLPVEDPTPTEAPVTGETPAPTETPIPEGAPTPTETPIPEGAPTPTETPIPEGAPAPEETPVPEGTSAPTEAPVPEGTPAPTETPVPEGTPAPTETPIPERTPAPTETPVPEGTPAPTETPVPEEPPALAEGPRAAGAPVPEEIPGSEETPQ